MLRCSCARGCKSRGVEVKVRVKRQRLESDDSRSLGGRSRVALAALGVLGMTMAGLVTAALGQAQDMDIKHHAQMV